MRRAHCSPPTSTGVASHNLLTATCKAAISQNTLLGDTLSLTATNRSRALKVDYDANQPSAAHWLVQWADGRRLAEREVDQGGERTVCIGSWVVWGLDGTADQES